jgi:hypothetical protein
VMAAKVSQVNAEATLERLLALSVDTVRVNS